MDPVTIIIVGLVVLFVIAVGMTLFISLSSNKARKQRVMSIIRGHAGNYAGSEGSEANPRNVQDRRRAEIAKKLKEQDNIEDKDNKKKKSSRTALLEQADLRISLRQYWIFSAVFAVVFALLGKMMGMSPLVVTLFFVIGLLGIPQLVVKKMIKRRQKKFLLEFPDALEAMARLLKAGMPVGEAVAMAGREFEGPVGDEMSRMYEAQKIGIPLPEAALQAARRMPVTEMQMLATGFSIQAQTGASLSEVLINLAKVIRARYRLRRKVQALSSEAKASAMIIGSLPFLVGGGLFLVNPDYMDPLFMTTTGKTMLAGAACWMGIGIFIMKIMINFKI